MLTVLTNFLLTNVIADICQQGNIIQEMSTVEKKNTSG